MNSKEEYQKFIDEFKNATKTVLKENISKDVSTILKNEERIIKAYNNLIENSNLIEHIEFVKLRNDFFKKLGSALTKTTKITGNKYTTATIY